MGASTSFRAAHLGEPLNQHSVGGLLRFRHRFERIVDQRAAAAMQHACHQHTPAALVIAILENLLEGMASQRAGVVQCLFFLQRARKIPKYFVAAQLRFHLGCRGQRSRLVDSLQNNLIQLAGAVDLHRIPTIGLEFQGIRDPQACRPRPASWEIRIFLPRWYRP